jgi:uncharacterized protein
MIPRLLFFAFALVTTISRAQQPGVVPPLISTTGQGEARVVPDLVDIRFEIEIRNADLTVARNEQGERGVKLLAALRAAGITETDLQTSHVQIAPRYQRKDEETDKVQFYTVSQSVSCTLKDLAKLPDLIAAGIAAGATGVDRSVFRTSQLTRHRADMRLRAVQAAREKAAVLASALGAKVGRPYTITETTGDYSGAITANVITTPIFAGGGGVSAAFAPGTIAVTETVAVSFLLE